MKTWRAQSYSKRFVSDNSSAAQYSPQRAPKSTSQILSRVLYAYTQLHTPEIPVSSIPFPLALRLFRPSTRLSLPRFIFSRPSRLLSFIAQATVLCAIKSVPDPTLFFFMLDSLLVSVRLRHGVTRSPFAPPPFTPLHHSPLLSSLNLFLLFLWALAASVLLTRSLLCCLLFVAVFFFSLFFYFFFFFFFFFSDIELFFLAKAPLLVFFFSCGSCSFSVCLAFFLRSRVHESRRTASWTFLSFLVRCSVPFRYDSRLSMQALVFIFVLRCP